MLIHWWWVINHRVISLNYLSDWGIHINKYILDVSEVPGKSLMFSLVGHLDVSGYTDADWAGSITNTRCTSSYFTYIGGNLVTWRSKSKRWLSGLVQKLNIKARLLVYAIGYIWEICSEIWVLSPRRQWFCIVKTKLLWILLTILFNMIELRMCTWIDVSSKISWMHKSYIVFSFVKTEEH